MAQRTGLIVLAAMTSILPGCFAGELGIAFAIVASAAQMARPNWRRNRNPVRSAWVASFCGLAAFFHFGPQPKKPGTVPFGPRYATCDFGKVAVGVSIVGEAVCQHHDAVTAALPLASKDRAGLDSPRQDNLAIRFCRKCLPHLIEQALRGSGEAAIGLLLNPVCDAAPEQIRAERPRRIGP